MSVFLQDGTGPSLWYPPIAVGIACLVRRGLGLWPVVFVADLALSWLQYSQQLPQAAIVALNTTLECALAAALLARLRFRTSLERGIDVVLMVGIAALFSTLVGATLGNLLLQDLPPDGSRGGAMAWFTWWVGDSVSTVTLLPVLLVTTRRTAAAERPLRAGTKLEGGLLVAATIATGLRHVFWNAGMFGELIGGWTLGVLPVLWAAIRFDLVVTTWTVAVLSFAAMIGLHLHPAMAAPEQRQLFSDLLNVQANLAMSSIVGLVLAQRIARERAERAASQRLASDLELREAHLRLAQKAGRTGSWEFDPATGERSWSSAMFDLFGFDQAAGVPALEAVLARVHPESRAAMQTFVDQALAGQEQPPTLARLELPVGGQRWVTLRSERVHRGVGMHSIGLATDVTDLVRGNEAAAKLATIVASTSEAILTIARDGTIVTWNESAAQLFGLLAEDDPRPFLALVPADRRERKQENIDRAFAGESVRAEHAIMLRTDGAAMPVRLSFSPVRDLGQRIVEVAIVCGDLTEQHALAQQLQHAQKMEAIGRLAGNISHDFNNMLTAIIGFSELAIARASAGTTVHKQLEQVLLAGQRATALTQRILAFTRLHGSEPEVLPLDALVQRLLPMLQRLIGETVHLHTRLQAGPALVRFDPTQLEQVLLNLLINARDAMPDGGRIWLETGCTQLTEEQCHGQPYLRPGAAVTLAVRDEGTGMDEATVARIFEPFFTTKEPGRGTGLGLSTVQTIAREHTSCLQVETALAVGTTFRLIMPESFIRQPADQAVGDHDEEARGRDATLLVVEDETMVREYLAMALRSAGYRVLLAGSAAAAAPVFHRDPDAVDALVTDLVMPGENGIELARRLRRERPQLPVLFVSGYSEGLGEAELGDPLLIKPFTREALLRALQRLLPARQSQPDP